MFASCSCVYPTSTCLGRRQVFLPHFQPWAASLLPCSPCCTDDASLGGEPGSAPLGRQMLCWSTTEPVLLLVPQCWKCSSLQDGQGFTCLVKCVIEQVWQERHRSHRDVLLLNLLSLRSLLSHAAFSSSTEPVCVSRWWLCCRSANAIQSSQLCNTRSPSCSRGHSRDLWRYLL